MKRTVALLIALYGGSLTGSADPSDAAEAFLRVDDAQWSYSASKEEHFKRSSFPKGLWHVVEGYFTPTGIDREAYVGFTHDLNADGQNEYFIETPLGGSGGPHFTVVSLRGDKWVEIASFQGAFHLLRGKEGWLPIVGYARGGADNYYKFRLEYRDGAYHEVWAANFSGGKIIEKISADSIAKRVIKSSYNPLYNRSSNTEDELFRDKVTNASFRLSILMQSEDVTEIVRLYYALSILKQSHEALRATSPAGNSGFPLLTDEMKIISRRIIELENDQVEQDDSKRLRAE